MKYWSSASSEADEHREAAVAPPAAAPLLPQRRDGAGEADRDHASSRPMSMPSSSALVADTPSSSPSASRRSISRRWTARVPGTGRRELGVVAQALGGEAMDELGRLAALCKGEVRSPRSTKRACSPPPRPAPSRAGRARRRAAAGSRARPCGPARGAPSSAITRHRRSEQLRTELGRIGDRCRREQELRTRSRRGARSAGAAAGRSRRASRRPRGRRVLRRRTT